MRTLDFRITSARDGALTQEEREAAIAAAEAALAAGASFEDAERAAMRAAFREWDEWPESAMLVDMDPDALYTRCWGDVYGVRARWSQASAPVFELDADGNWVATGRQVADYLHIPEAALRDALVRAAEDSGGRTQEARRQIDAAVCSATSRRPA